MKKIKENVFFICLSIKKNFSLIRAPANRLFSKDFYYPFDQISKSKICCSCFKSVTNETKEECTLGLLQTTTSSRSRNQRRSDISKTFDLDQLVSGTNITLDSQHLLQLLNDIHLKENMKIYSLDFDALYPNMDLFDVICKITHFMSSRLNNDHIDIIAFKWILE
jgi:hypothetical protein